MNTCYLLTLPRKHTPCNEKSTEETVQIYSTQDFKTHFHLWRTTFEVILRFMTPSLTVVHERKKQLSYLLDI